VPGLEEQTRPNLDKKLSELVSEGEEVVVSDRALPVDLKFNFIFKK
jgi:ubiquitin-activating enzyme E1 C